MLGEYRRIVLALGVSEWTTFMEHARALGEDELVDELKAEQVAMLLEALSADGYLFFPGERDLREGPALARRYYTEHYADSQ